MRLRGIDPVEISADEESAPLVDAGAPAAVVMAPDVVLASPLPCPPPPGAASGSGSASSLRAPEPPKKKSRKPIPVGVCIACHNIANGHAPGKGHDYSNLMCTFTPAREPQRSAALKTREAAKAKAGVPAVPAGEAAPEAASPGDTEVLP